MWERFLAAWCRMTHNEAMWPMHGRYVCRRCLREHEVAWARAPRVDVAAPPARSAHTASASMDVCA
jgi:hypothetical protein